MKPARFELNDQIVAPQALQPVGDGDNGFPAQVVFEDAQPVPT